MATYVNDLRLKEIATGDESGTWGTSTNTNLELIGEAFSFGTEAITTNADTHTTTIADGSTDPGRSLYLKYTGTLDSACTITIGPNTVSKLWFIENGTSGSQNIIISQGSGANVTIPAGHVKAVYSDGAGSSAAMVDAFTDLNLAGTTTVSVLSVSSTTTFSDDVTFTGASNNLVWDKSDDCLEFADNAKAKFGASDDLQIYHDGSNSRIQEGGTGSLLVRGTNLQLQDSDGFDYITCTDGGDGGTVVLKHLGSAVLSTASGGITVTSAINDMTIASSGLTGPSSQNFAINTPNSLRINIDSNNSATDQVFVIGHNQTTVDNNNALLTILESGNVGIGTSGPDSPLEIDGGSSANTVLHLTSTTANTFLKIADSNTNEGNFIGCTTDDLTFFTRNSERLRMDSTGKVGIGTTSPNATLHVGTSNATGDATNPAIQIGGSSTYRGAMYTTSEGFILDNNNGDDGISFFTKTNGEMMRLQADGVAHITSAGAPIAPTIKHGGSTGDVSKLRLINRSGQGADKGGALELGGVTDDGVSRSDVFGSVAGLKTNATSANRQGYLQFSTSSGSALSERMRINSSGDIGIGTTSPQSALHIAEGGSGSDGGSVLTLSQTGFGTIVNNDDLGSVHFGGVTSGGVGSHACAKIMVEGDGTFGTNDFPTRMGFFTTADGGNTLSENMRLTNAGLLQLGTSIGNSTYAGLFNGVSNVGTGAIIQTRNGDGKKHIMFRGDNNVEYGSIGLSSPTGSGALQLQGEDTIVFNTNTDTERMRISATGKILIGTTSGVRGAEDLSIQAASDAIAVRTAGAGLIVRKSSFGNGFLCLFENDSATQVGAITSGGSSTVFNTSSDYRLKENIEPMQNGLERLNQLNPVKFTWKETGEESEGFIAHEVDEIFSDCIHGEKDGENMQGMDYGRITPLLVKAIQELHEQVDALQSEIKTLKGE
jgi:hypothetical protein